MDLVSKKGNSNYKRYLTMGNMEELKESFGNVLSEKKRKDLGRLEKDLRRDGMNDGKIKKINEFIDKVRREEANRGEILQR